MEKGDCENAASAVYCLLPIRERLYMSGILILILLVFRAHYTIQALGPSSQSSRAICGGLLGVVVLYHKC